LQSESSRSAAARERKRAGGRDSPFGNRPPSLSQQNRARDPPSRNDDGAEDNDLVEGGSRSKVARKKAGHDLINPRYSMFPSSPAAAAAAAAAGLHQTQLNQHAQLHAHQLHQQYLQLQTQMLIMQHQLQHQQDMARSQQKANNSREFDETNVYVAHLPITMTHEEFFELMSKFGTVVSSRILVGDHWRKKGVKGVGFARYLVKKFPTPKYF
jgi:hypothetical protein